jgi:hypothetical protein
MSLYEVLKQCGVLNKDKQCLLDGKQVLSKLGGKAIFVELPTQTNQINHAFLSKLWDAD